MKIGIKCEIHDCTIALVHFLEKEDVIDNNVSEIFKRDKELRIDNQYYLKNIPTNINFEELANFLLSIKTNINKLDSEKIKELRRKIEKM